MPTRHQHVYILALAFAVICLVGPANPRTTVAYTSAWVTRGALRPNQQGKREEKPQIVATLFEKFLSYQTYSFPVKAYGSPEIQKGGFVYGPGHHSAALAALMLDPQRLPLVTLKTGDLRYSRVGRSEPYMLDGFVAGRLDKGKTGSEHIALAELSEEIGGEIVGDSFRPLGDQLNPTMPLESTECDSYFVALVKTTKKPTGDGGKMEVPGLIGAKVVTPEEAWVAFEQGKVSDAGRAQVLYGRALDSIGYVRRHRVYIQDHPELATRYSSLGLGDPWDPRLGISEVETYRGLKSPSQTGPAIDSVVVVERSAIPLDSGEMVDALVRHAVGGKAVGEPFHSQYLKLSYDRLKLAAYFVDPEKGPMIQFTGQFRPPLKFAPGEPNVFRKDVADTPIERGVDFAKRLENTVELGSGCGASSGQSDLYYRFGATKVEAPDKPTGQGFITLAQALQDCRSGQGDVETETLLLRLADYLHWNPNLGMSWEQIDQVLD